eukprot:6782232-Alexandrium_andersonii.AAC.1
MVLSTARRPAFLKHFSSDVAGSSYFADCSVASYVAVVAGATAIAYFADVACNACVLVGACVAHVARAADLDDVPD